MEIWRNTAGGGHGCELRAAHGQELARDVAPLQSAVEINLPHQLSCFIFRGSCFGGDIARDVAPVQSAVQINLCLVVCDSGKVSLEHFLLSRYPCQRSSANGHTRV